MATENLSADEWRGLLRTVFAPAADERVLAVIIDVPDSTEDNDHWRDRRCLAAEWRDTLDSIAASCGLERVEMYAYPDVGSNNADLPETVFRTTGVELDFRTLDADQLAERGEAIALDDVLASTNILLLPTEHSATAPMKLGARKHPYKAATMPGFLRSMIPALRLDFAEINRRLVVLKEKLDAADAAIARFRVDGDVVHEMTFDLRFRSATASGGLLRSRGMAGNLPSGETYIVPYEGEGEEVSATRGVLPVQFDDEIVLYEIEANNAKVVVGAGEVAARERDFLVNEPAYGNISELGFGVLRDLGVQPVGSILLDEKLGFHVAFGRSDHFGGIVGTDSFRDPKNVIHIDRIYIPETQPRVCAEEVRLRTGDREEVLIVNGEYAAEVLAG